MIKRTFKTLLEYLPKISWALFLVFLPLTSFPYFPHTIGGSALVRPLSLYPLFILLVLVTIPSLLKKPVYPTILALLPFILIVILGSMLSLLRDIQPALGVSVTERALRGLITLGVGVSIYLTVTLFPRSQDDLRASLRWLYIGFSLALFWGSLQAVYIIHFNKLYYRWLNRIQSHLSIRRLFTTRVSGFTYEPNWFAEQITFLLIPWLLAAVLTGYSAFRWRWRWVTVEWIMLGWSIGVLIFTFSRTGLLVLGALIIISLLVLRPLPKTTSLGGKITLNRITRRVLEASVALILLTSSVFIAGQNNEFFSRIWNYWDKKNTSITGYFEYLGFGARFSYGESAWNMFLDNPILGVGVGNYAFYFEDYLPDEPVAPTPEILRLITPDRSRQRLVTPKNLYLRLLSETGLIGFGTFVTFSLTVFGCAIFLWLSPKRNSPARFWGTGGILALSAFTIAAVSYDSFAIPNMWVTFGLITAATWLIFQTKRVEVTSTNSNRQTQTISNQALPRESNL
jgi:O-antigen ligase